MVNTVVLDKTGTLTFGEPKLQVILTCPGVSEDQVLDAAAYAELRSEHPLGKTIVAAARTNPCRGRGVYLYPWPRNRGPDRE